MIEAMEAVLWLIKHVYFILIHPVDNVHWGTDGPVQVVIQPFLMA